MTGDSPLDRMRAAGESHDLDALEHAAAELDPRAPPSPEALLELCNLLSSADLGDRERQRRIEQQIALVALEVPTHPDPETEIALLGHVRPAVVAAGQAPGGNGRDWTAERRRIAGLWLSAWQRLDAALAALEAPGAKPQLGLAPPAGSPQSSGTAPGQIADPERAAQYEAAVAANREANERSGRAHRLRLLAGPFRREAEALLSGAYGAPPFPPEELRGLLADHVADPDARQRVLAAVEARARDA